MEGRADAQRDSMAGKNCIATAPSVQIARILGDIIQDITAGRKKLVMPLEPSSGKQNQDRWNIWDEVARELNIRNCSPEILRMHRVHVKRCLVQLLRNAGYAGGIRPNCLDPLDVHEPNPTAHGSIRFSRDTKEQAQEDESERPPVTSKDDSESQLSDPLHGHVHTSTTEPGRQPQPSEANPETGSAERKGLQPQRQPSTKSTSDLQLLRALHAKEQSDFEIYALKRAARHHRNGNIATVVDVILLLSPIIRVWVEYGWKVCFNFFHSENATIRESAEFVYLNTALRGSRI